jgi:hypothetical protein
VRDGARMHLDRSSQNRAGCHHTAALAAVYGC